MTDLIDLLVIDGNLVLDENGLPQLIGGRQVVAQDLIHRIQDDGLLFQLIGQRSAVSVAQTLQQIVLSCEQDRRVIPGTVKTSFINDELFVVCQSDVGDVEIALPVIDPALLPVPEPEFVFPKVLGPLFEPVVEIIKLGPLYEPATEIIELGAL